MLTGEEVPPAPVTSIPATPVDEVVPAIVPPPPAAAAVAVVVPPPAAVAAPVAAPAAAVVPAVVEAEIPVAATVAETVAAVSEVSAPAPVAVPEVASVETVAADAGSHSVKVAEPVLATTVAVESNPPPAAAAAAVQTESVTAVEVPVDPRENGVIIGNSQPPSGCSSPSSASPEPEEGNYFFYIDKNQSLLIDKMIDLFYCYDFAKAC